MDTTLRIDLQAPEQYAIQLEAPVVDGARDYERLRNRPAINGVELIGDRTAAELRLVTQDTTAGWQARTDYIPKRGEIIVYTDYKTVEDDLGNTIDLPGVKIGDGSAYAVDLPFADAAVRYELMQALREHERDALIHVTQADRDFWNAKLNYSTSGETLIFNRL